LSSKPRSQPSSSGSSSKLKILLELPSSSFARPVFFHLVKSTPPANLLQDYKSILDYLATFGDIGLLKQSDSDTTITYPDSPVVSHLSIAPPDRIILTCEKIDNTSINLLRNVAPRHEFRVYNPVLGCFLVNEPNLLDLTTIEVEPMLRAVFSIQGLEPLFNYRNSLVYYARELASDRVHLVNRHLLEYLTHRQGKLTKVPNFSVAVAADLSHFIALFDRGLISTNFYHSWSKTDQITNLSGFNSHRVETNLFITPVFFELDKPNQTFRQRELPQAPFKTALSQGSSFDHAIKSILAASLGTTDYLAAKIPTDITFVPDSGAELVPRLSVSIFLEQI